jgi:uncharacterized RDD family membrane protein YckC
MVDTALADDVDALQPAYARFSRRLRALVIDGSILVFIAVGSLIIMDAVDSDAFSRMLGIAVVAVLLLYEPVMVSRTGSSVGHYLTNLRVVDDRTQGNVGFVKALARLVIKTVLGWYSFITMATTRRHQALHDLLTRSTVQIRDPAKASSDQYAHERSVSDSSMPSVARRVLVILAYLLLSYVLLLIANTGLILIGGLSRRCTAGGYCTAGEELLRTLTGMMWLALCVLVIVQGWRGRMPGCRAKRIQS